MSSSIRRKGPPCRLRRATRVAPSATTAEHLKPRRPLCRRLSRHGRSGWEQGWRRQGSNTLGSQIKVVTPRDGRFAVSHASRVHCRPWSPSSLVATYAVGSEDSWPGCGRRSGRIRRLLMRIGRPLVDLCLWPQFCWIQFQAADLTSPLPDPAFPGPDLALLRW